MPLNFPTGPTNGQIYENYRWSSTVGAWQSLSSGAAVTMSESAPVGAFNGQLWFNETEGKMYVSYYDGTSTQWVSAIGGLASQTGAAGDLLRYDGTSWVATSVNNAMDAGKILQVVHTTKNDVFTTTSTTYTDLTGLSANITPRSTSSKIIAIASVEGATTTATTSSTGSFRVVRDSTPLDVGAAGGVGPQSAGVISTRNITSIGLTMATTKSFQDSPATTSTLNYKVQVRVGAGTLFINRAEDDSTSLASNRFISTLTLMEVAG